METGNGHAALEIFRRAHDQIDVVLLDMTLPGISGPEIFTRLRSIHPGVKVVFTTAYSEETLSQALAGNKQFGFLRKPYHLQDLVTQLDHAIGIGAPAESAKLVRDSGTPQVNSSI